MKKKVKCYALPWEDISKLWRIMRLTFFIFLISLINVSGNAFSQQNKMSLKYANVTLKDAFQAIEENSNYVFFYNAQQIQLDEKVSLNVENKSIEDILDELFQDKPISYKVTDRRIVLFPKTEGESPSLMQQKQPVKGKVTGAEGDPIPGATVVVKGTMMGTVTDIDGEYQLSEVSSDATLVISFVGFRSQEIAVVGQTVINVVLEEETIGLEEVVAIGYGTVNKKEVTSAVSHVSSAELLQTGSTNPMMSIQGKVSGLTITNTGGSDPNAGPSIQLRGVSSRDAGSSPLVVIDGVPGGNLENINQNDIQSIDVLKDGAASAIYGTQGSAGVILVTTKTGKSGAMTANYNGYVSTDIPIFQLKNLSTEEFLAHERGTDYGADTDWQKEVMRSYNLTHSHTLSVSGGNANSNYRATLDYRDAEGLDLRSDREEYGARFSLNHSSKDDLYDISLSIAPRYFKRNDSNYDAFTKALTLNPTYPVLDPNDDSRYYDIPEGSDGHFNPVELLKLEQSGSEAKFLDWSGTFKLNINDQLNTQVTLAQSTKDYFDFWFRPATSSIAQRNGYDGEASRAYNKFDQKTFDWLGNYYLDANKHSLKAMFGYSYQYTQSSGLSADNKDFTSDALTYNNLGDGLYQQEEGRNGFGSYKNDSKLIAFFGRLSYSYNDKYLATASLRYEGSSKFGATNKWGYFPAVSVGWRISNEPFLESASWINDLKLRADYGITGNQSFGNYLSLSVYSGYGYYLFNGKYYQVWGPGNNTNTDLKWEKGKNMNVGLDFVLFNNVLEGSVNYYRRKQQDLLGWYNAPLPPNPHTQTYANVGTMQNVGVELDLNINAVNHKDFKYRIGVVGATNDNKFISFSNDIFQGQPYVDMVYLPGPGTPGPAQRLQEGERIGNFYMWKFAGVDQLGNMLVYDQNDEVIQANQATNDDKRIVGNGLPKFTASLNNTFQYKNWDLAFYLRGVFGYDIFNVHDFYYGLQSSPTNENVLPAAYGQNSPIKGDKVLCDYFLEKGDYVKLDVVTLGYTLKPVSKYFSSIRFYATGKNLARITGFSGVDPETYPINGLTPGVTGSKSYYPSTAQVLVGVQVNF